MSDQNNVKAIPKSINTSFTSLSGCWSGTSSSSSFDDELRIHEAHTILYSSLNKLRKSTIFFLCFGVLTITLLIGSGWVGPIENIFVSALYWMAILLGIINMRYTLKHLKKINDEMLDIIMEAI